MKNLILTSILTFANLLTVAAQNYIYKGDNQYESTSSWEFNMNGRYWTGNPEFTVAKHSSGGYLMIALNVPFKSHYIGGTVTVFLSDGSTIKCVDRGTRDHVNNQSIALYNFTNSEIVLLRSYRITRIRFSIMVGVSVGNSEGVKTFTADNTEPYRLGLGQMNYFKTEMEIDKLFE